MPHRVEVDAWLRAYDNPMKPVVVRVREIILAADPRMDECIKWQTPTFTFEEIVELAPGQKLVMRIAQGPFPMETTYTWGQAGTTHTHMTLRNRGEPSGFSRLAAPFMEAAMRRANTKDLARLKALLESRG